MLVLIEYNYVEGVVGTRSDWFGLINIVIGCVGVVTDGMGLTKNKLALPEPPLPCSPMGRGSLPDTLHTSGQICIYLCVYTQLWGLKPLQAPDNVAMHAGSVMWWHLYWLPGNACFYWAGEPIIMHGFCPHCICRQWLLQLQKKLFSSKTIFSHHYNYDLLLGLLTPKMLGRTPHIYTGDTSCCFLPVTSMDTTVLPGLHTPMATLALHVVAHCLCPSCYQLGLHCALLLRNTMPCYLGYTMTIYTYISPWRNKHAYVWCKNLSL